MHLLKPRTAVESLCLLLIASPISQVLSQNPHEGHDHSSVPQGEIIIDHQLNPAAAAFKPADFVNDLFTEYSTGTGAQRAVTLDGLVKVYQAMSIIPSGAVETDPHAGHDHLRRRTLREVAVEGRRSLLAVRQATVAVPVTDACLLPFDIMTIYGMNTTRGVNRTEFERITPALVYVSSAKLCKAKEFQFNNPEANSTTSGNDKPSTGLVWLYSLVSVTIVTLCCMLGLLFVPLMKRSAVVTDIILSFLIALGAGTLISDATIHLLPSLLGLHDHDHAEGAVEEGPHDLSYVWKLNIALLGLYLFWAAEQGLQYLHGRHTSSSSHAHSHHHHHHHHHHSNNALGHEGSVPHLHTPSIAPSVASITSSDEESTLPKTSSSQNGQTVWQDFTKVKPVAVLILLGDSLHNFIDGLAIGASFAYSTRMGLTTSLAVLLHELPHELADYAILYSSGFSAWRAAYLNALSNATSYVGLIIGIFLTTSTSGNSKNGVIKSAQETIFALGAGMFIYIAIADLLPTLREVHTVGALTTEEMEEANVERKEGLGASGEKTVVLVESAADRGEKGGVECEHQIHSFSWKRVVAQHIGLLTGWVLMLLLALYEEKIKV
ncbi:hypothetical protein HDV05_004808 [Chytridiales sp. JEL 0842]|nr:hypothetical protein HDV05_004808 [Chytridiales sp. JEL 0842]